MKQGEKESTKFLLLICVLAIAFLVAIAMSGCETTDKKDQPTVVESADWGACAEGFYKNEHKRKAPPKEFLQDLLQWIQKAPEFLYAVNSQPKDAFSHLRSELGITSKSSLKYRQAALFELMRVSAAMESSYDWSEGRDLSASNYDYYTQEAGIFQTSPNSHVSYKDGYYFRWQYLDKLVAKHGVGKVSIINQAANKAWNSLMKDYQFKDTILEHHAFMLRHNYRHYGPVIDKRRVGMNLNLECLKEIAAKLQ